jgi:hypothetical protein
MSEIPSHIGACEFGMLRQSLCAARDSLTRSCVMPAANGRPAHVAG